MVIRKWKIGIAEGVVSALYVVFVILHLWEQSLFTERRGQRTAWHGFPGPMMRFRTYG